jgi:hypothetical protein
MPRDIPQGKKMPSLTAIIGVGGKGKGPTPPAGLAKTDPAPDAGPSNDTGNESSFTCPECGASLKCESAGESLMEHGEESGEAAGGMGA